MVLGLIDFLLGGKRKTKVPKNAQASTPLTGVGSSGTSGDKTPEAGSLPDGKDTPTENSTPQFQDTTTENQSQGNPVTASGSGDSSSNSNQGTRRPMNDVISKIHDQLKDTNEKITGMVTEIKTMQNDVNSFGHRLDDLEESKKVTDEKLSEIDTNMTKFLSLYELINNQYNPFVEKDANGQSIEPMVLGADGNSTPSDKDSMAQEVAKTLEDLKKDDNSTNKTININSNDLNSSLLELDTLNIEEAAGDAVPLTRLKNNTNSLVIILSWLEYLVKKVGIEETRNTLNYYTDTLKWITPEVYFDLDKYLKGMKGKKLTEEGANSLSIKDHIVSLYFISKLNEKSLDPKLTHAVLQIIKE